MKLFTIIVPTRERCDTLVQTLETCVCQNADGFQIIVSDNFSQDATREVVQDFQRRDPRVHYINPGRRLGMSAHFEFALGHVKEGMVMLIGDDDGLMPGAITRARELLEARPETQALHWTMSSYLYPDLTGPELPGMGRNHLVVGLGTGTEVRDARQWLKWVATGKAIYTQLPSAYHAFVDMKVIEMIRAKTGRFVSSPIPDLFLALATSSLIPDYLHIDQSLSINATSKHSTGFSTIVPGADVKSAKTFLAEDDIGFCKDVPYITSIHIITCGTLLTASEIGLLPPDVPIDCKQLIANSRSEADILPFSPDQREARIAALQDFADRADSLPALQCRKVEEELGQPPDTPLTKLDLSICGAKGVVDATKIVAVLSDASAQAADAQRNREASIEAAKVPTASPQEILQQLTRLEEKNAKLADKNAKLEQFKMRLFRDYRVPMASKDLSIGLTFARLLRRVARKLGIRS